MEIMIVAICVLAWLLISTWLAIIIMGIDYKWAIDEWMGMAFACICSPICFFIVCPIVFAVKRIKKRKKSEPKIHWAEYDD